MRLLVEAGFSLSEAVQCATMTGAELLNLAENGILSVGQKADILAVQGPPEGLFDQLQRNTILVHAGTFPRNWQTDV